MEPFELVDLAQQIEQGKTETQTLEAKSAKQGCPKKLYDTLSSFSNQDDGGIIVFGINEANNFAIEGVYDAHDLQTCIVNQCKQMSPVVRPVLTVGEVSENVQIVSAEIPGLDMSDRPCFYAGIGRTKGSFIRTGDADERMTEYEIYSFEAYRKKYEDELCVVKRASIEDLDDVELKMYLLKLKSTKPNLAKLSDARVLKLMGITREGLPTLASVLVFAPYPQAYFPQLCIIATSIAGVKKGDIAQDGARFIDNKRIEGPLPAVLDEALQFVRVNMKTRTIIDSDTGKRSDTSDYPIEALREAILNALIHRDYSIHTQGMPVQITLFEDRLEISNPGGLYGRLSIDQLGKIQPDTRNPVIATTMEALGLTENRYAGIPTIQRTLRESNLPEATFVSSHGTFEVTFRKKQAALHESEYSNSSEEKRRTWSQDQRLEALLDFCTIPRTRAEIAAFLGLASVSYALRTYVNPLINQGKIVLSVPKIPQSPYQTYRAIAQGKASREK